MNKLVKNKGFTLSEVLVTLAIIGVVAAITIPALIKSNEEKKLRSGAKNAYSMLANTLSQMDTNGIILDFSASATVQDTRDKLCQQLNCIKTGTITEIFPPFYYWYNNTGDSWDTSSSTNHSAILNNGMLVKTVNHRNDCTKTFGALNTICASIDIDTNGKSGPNMIGKDWVGFWIIKENGSYIVVPEGSKGDGFTCASKGTTWDDSIGCSAYLILNKELP